MIVGSRLSASSSPTGHLSILDWITVSDRESSSQRSKLSLSETKCFFDHRSRNGLMDTRRSHVDVMLETRGGSWAERHEMVVTMAMTTVVR